MHSIQQIVQLKNCILRTASACVGGFETVTPCAAASEQRQSARRPSTAANATVADAGQPPAPAA